MEPAHNGSISFHQRQSREFKSQLVGSDIHCQNCVKTKVQPKKNINKFHVVNNIKWYKN